MTDQDCKFYMQQALDEGKKALPHCTPNPPVGCIVVRNNKVIARGHTQPPYQPHAEAMALSQVEGSLQDCTLFVTLEPCSFEQRTPSCAKTLISRQVKSVYVAILDPHPRNQGAGIKMLQEAGIQVQVGILANEAAADLGIHLSAEQ